MTAREFVTPAPLQVEPPGGHVVESGRRLALLDALRGIELGGYDERIVEWLARGEVGTVRTFVSWLERVREAGYVLGLNRMFASVEREMCRGTGSGESDA